jgi:hypothetical protein
MSAASLVSLPDVQERRARSAKLTPAERAAQMERDPKTVAILTQNNACCRARAASLSTGGT